MKSRSSSALAILEAGSEISTATGSATGSPNQQLLQLGSRPLTSLESRPPSVRKILLEDDEVIKSLMHLCTIQYLTNRKSSQAATFASLLGQRIGLNFEKNLDKKNFVSRGFLFLQNYDNLTGNAFMDCKLVCRWIAESYGEENPDYHKAYSREIIRQGRQIYYGENNMKPRPAWF